MLAFESKRIRVDAELFTGALLKESDAKRLQRIGINWAVSPNWKIANTREQINYWRTLPSRLNFVLEHCANKATTQLGGIYNKIKHGPQLIISDLLVHLAKCGVNADDLEKYRLELSQRGLRPETVRVLFEGATTAIGDQSKGNPNLFLDDDYKNVEQLFGRFIYPLSKAMWHIGIHIQLLKFGKRWVAPPSVIRNECEAILNKTYAIGRLEEFNASN